MKLPGAVTRTVARQGLKLSKNAPSLLFGVGLAGSISSTVLACRATLKLHDVLEETESDLEMARALDHPEYSEEDRRRDCVLIYARTTGQIVRLYGPAVIVGGVAIGCLAKSHNLLAEQNMALTAAYAAVDRAFEKYRGRVIDEYGEEKDREFRYDVETREIEVDGGLKEVRELAATNEHSMYARFFDEYSASWSKEPEYNLLFLRCQQNYANDLLKSRGHVFLNEVYDMLGIQRSKAGAVVGWVVSDFGDNFVDFGIFDPSNDQARDFVNGREGSILLDFNVDGVIFDKISDHGERLAWQS